MKKNKKTIHRPFFQMGILAVSVAMIAYGTLRGEVMTVFHKATNICLECIGLG